MKVFIKSLIWMAAKIPAHLAITAILLCILICWGSYIAMQYNPGLGTLLIGLTFMLTGAVVVLGQIKRHIKNIKI